MGWTEEKVSELIDLYRVYPELWDTSSKEYKNREKKSEALQSISEIMGVNIVEVERKINVILAQYRKTRTRVIQLRNRGLDSATIGKSIWYGYKLLSFLEDRYATSTRAADLQPEVAVKEEDGESDLEPGGSRTIGNGEDDSERGTDDCLQGKLEVCLTEEDGGRRGPGLRSRRLQARRFPRRSCCCPRREVDLFAGQLALKLARFPPAPRARLMHRLYSILHQEEMKLYQEEEAAEPPPTTREGILFRKLGGGGL